MQVVEVDDPKSLVHHFEAGSSFVDEIAGYFASNLLQLIIQVLPVYSIVSHLDIYFDFAHHMSVIVET